MSFFVTPEGRFNPEAERAASLAALDSARGHDFACAFPYRYEWLRATRRDRPVPAFDLGDCAELAAFRQSFRLGKVRIAYATEQVDTPASAFGHVLLFLGDDETPLPLWETVQFLAETSGTDSFLGYAVRGLNGGFLGRYQRSAVFQTAFQYNHREQRDLYVADIPATPEQLEWLLLRLFEMRKVLVPPTISRPGTAAADLPISWSRRVFIRKSAPGAFLRMCSAITSRFRGLAWSACLRSTPGSRNCRAGRPCPSRRSEWLIGNQDTSSKFTGLSFDGIRTTYTADSFTVDFLSLKLSETFNNFADGDANLYGIYGSYIGLEDWQLDAYWLYVMEDEGDNGVATVAEGVFGAAAGDADLHTIGLRGAGTYGAFDLESEIAYQFGEIDVDNGGFLGDDDLEYDALAFNLEAGYTFDITWTPPRVLGRCFLRRRRSGQRLLLLRRRRDSAARHTRLRARGHAA